MPPHSRATMVVSVPTENYARLLEDLAALSREAQVEVLVGSERRIGSRGIFSRRVYSSSSVDFYGSPVHLTRFASDLRSLADRFS